MNNNVNNSGPHFEIEGLDTLPEPTETTEWFIPGLLIKGGLNYLTAYPGHGKSLCSLDLALACTQSRKFLGIFDVPQTGVLYIDQDGNNPRELNKRILDFGFEAGAPLSRMNQQGVRLDDREHVEWLRKECLKRGIGLVILDAMVRMHRLNEGNPAEMAIIREHVQLLTKEGITVLMIHHNSRRMTFRGSSEIIAMADSMCSLRKSKGGKSFTLEIVKERTEFESDWNKIEIEARKVGGKTFLKGRTYMSNEGEDSELDDAVLEFCTEDPKTKSEIRDAIKGDAKKIDSAIELLLGRGHLSTTQVGRKKLYLTVEDQDQPEVVVD